MQNIGAAPGLPVLHEIHSCRAAKEIQLKETVSRDFSSLYLHQTIYPGPTDKHRKVFKFFLIFVELFILVIESPV